MRALASGIVVLVAGLACASGPPAADALVASAPPPASVAAPGTVPEGPPSASPTASGGVTGTWKDETGESSILLAQSGDEVRFRVEAGVELPGGVRHVGVATGSAKLADGRLEWSDGACRIAIGFAGDDATVRQEGSDAECGFGAGVYADGTYHRVSRDAPDLAP